MRVTVETRLNGALTDSREIAGTDEGIDRMSDDNYLQGAMPSPTATQVLAKREQLISTLRIIRAACDQIEREGLRLVQSPAWVRAEFDQHRRLDHLQIDIRLEP